MAADFSIKWNREGQRFEKATIRAEIRLGRSTVPMEVKQIILRPDDIIKVEVDPVQASDTVVSLTAELTGETLDDDDFYERITKPVEVEIVAEPLAEMAMTAAAITAGKPEVRRTCTVEVELPPATIHWRQVGKPELGDDPTCEVEADGEDVLDLEVWLERFIPAKRMVDRDDSIHFTHMTGKTFRPRIFGPHPDDLPWVVAQPGSGNRRERSKWKSNAFLPSEKHPEAVPLEGTIRVRAWGPKDITGRHPNAIDPPPREQLAEQPVPVTLVPIAISVRKVEPAEPTPADAQPHEIVLELTRTRTGAPLKNGEVSWEVEPGDGPSGTVDPGSVVLTEADGGRAKFNHTVPEMTYTPRRSWKQELKVYAGTGAKRRPLTPVTLYVSPRIRAELLGEKKGLDFEPPYTLDIAADEAPCTIIAHHGFGSLESDVPDNEHVFDALPHITAITESGQQAIPFTNRTDAGGTYTWELPELKEGLAGLSEDRRTRILEAFEEESAADFDERGLDLLKQYRAYLATPKPRVVFDRLLSAENMMRLKEQPKVMGRQLATKPEADTPKTQEGTVIVLAALRGTVIIDSLHAELFDKALDLMVKFLWDALDYLIKVKKIGDRIANYLGSTRVYDFVSTKLQWALGRFARLLMALRNAIASRSPAVADAITRVLDAIEGRGSLPDSIRDMALTAQTKISEGLIAIVQRIEQSVLAMVFSESSPLLGEALHYGGKKSAEKAVKALSKKIQKLLSGAAGTFSSYAELKAWLRSDLPGLGLEETAQRVVGATAANVAAANYSYDPAACERYLHALQGLENRNVELDANIGFVDEIVSEIDLVCDVLAVLAVLAAVLSGGTLGVGAIAVLSAITVPKIIAKSTVHAFQGLQLAAAAYNLVDLYEQETMKLTRSNP